MKKKRGHKATAPAKTPVQNLPPRDADATKGGAAYTLADASSDVLKSIGDALQSAARKG